MGLNESSLTTLVGKRTAPTKEKCPDNIDRRKFTKEIKQSNEQVSSSPISIPRDQSSQSDSCGLETTFEEFSAEDESCKRVQERDQDQYQEQNKSVIKLMNNVYISRFHQRYSSERVVAPKVSSNHNVYSLEHSIGLFAIIYFPNWSRIYQDVFLYLPSRSENVFFQSFLREHKNIDANDQGVLKQFFVCRAKQLKLLQKLKSEEHPLGISALSASFRKFSEILFSTRKSCLTTPRADSNQGCLQNSPTCSSPEGSSLRKALEEAGEPCFCKPSLKMLLTHYIIVHYRNYQEIWDEKFLMLTQRLQKRISAFLKEDPCLDPSFLPIFNLRTSGGN